MKRLAAALVLATLALTACGDSKPTASAPEATTPPATATPTPTPTPTVPPAGQGGNVSVRIVDGTLEVEPRQIKRDDGAISLQLENTTADLAEVLLTSGNPGSDYDAIQDAVVTGDAVQAGQRQLDRVSVKAGRYTLILRPVEPNPEVLDSVRLRVR